jgi:hypothetical protein
MSVLSTDYQLFEDWLAFCKTDSLEDKTIKGYRHNAGLFLWWFHPTAYAGK